MVSMVVVQVVGRLVVQSKEDLMILDGEGKKTLDLMRIVQEGEKVNSTVVESDCPGVMKEIADYEFITKKGWKQKTHIVEITRVLDTVTERTIFNAAEPWVRGSLKIR